jgi:hypothetical protein
MLITILKAALLTITSGPNEDSMTLIKIIEELLSTIEFST